MVPAYDPTLTHSRLIKRLLRKGDAISVKIANVLDHCRSDNPCRRGACPICGALFQADMVAITQRFSKSERFASRRGRKELLTIVPSSGLVSLECVCKADFKRVKREIASALTECDLPEAVGYLDVAFNENDGDTDASHWCIHVHLQVTDWLSRPQRAYLSERFPATAETLRPVHAVHLDNDERALRYIFESESDRRISYVDAGSPQRAPHRNTRGRDLTPAQSVILARVKYSIGFRGRLMLHAIAADPIDEALDALGWPRDGP